MITTVPNGSCGQSPYLIRAEGCRQGADGNGVQHHVAGESQCDAGPTGQHGDQIHEVFCRAGLSFSCHSRSSIVQIAEHFATFMGEANSCANGCGEIKRN